VIRAYRRDDFAAVLTLVTTTLTEYGFPAHIGNVQQDLHDIETHYGRARAGFWVAEIDAGLAGTVALRPKVDRESRSATQRFEAKPLGGLGGGAPHLDRTCELKRLYVHKSARGQGVGRALYANAEAFARAAGYDRIWLESSRLFTEARRLYERNGFTLVEELDNDWHDNVYEKRLA
jgi:putative acetyltransferase